MIESRVRRCVFLHLYPIEKRRRKKQITRQPTDDAEISRKLFTVAKKGPEKNPSRLAATASVIILGTLSGA
jgi:hypothetical protein